MARAHSTLASVGMAVLLVTCLALLFASASAQTFVPKNISSPPQYNFHPYLPNRVWINGTFVFVGPQYVTPNILWGLGVGFFMLVILYVALSCLMGVQRPVRMSTVPLVLSKEY